MKPRFAVAALLVCLAVSTGCATTPPASVAARGRDVRAERLEAQLTAIASEAGSGESRMLAEAALRQARALAIEYGMTRPPQLHNVLVNIGLKERGLCWHWTEDLLARLGELPLAGYELHWATAYRGEVFREHNSVIVTARGEALETGLVLDPWRNSGELYWSLVSEDRYPWKAH